MKKTNITKAQIKGKLQKRLRKETRQKLKKKMKELVEKKRKLKERKEIKRLNEKKRRETKKLLLNNENDVILVNWILNEMMINNKYAKYYNFTYHAQKIKAVDILSEIVHHMKYAIPWRANQKYKYSTLYTAYSKFVNRGILESTYVNLINKYCIANKEHLQIQSTDVTVVGNKYGSELVKYNGHKKKNCTKISQIHIKNGPVIGIKIDNGSKHDSKVFIDHLDKKLFIPNKLNNENKKYMLADSGYDEKELKIKLIEMNYKPIIYPNNRKSKIKRTMNDDDKIIYKNRMISTEHTYNQEKTHRRVNCRYERRINTFYNSLLLSCIDFIIKK